MESRYFKVTTFKVKTSSPEEVIYLFCGFAAPLIYYIPSIEKFNNLGYTVFAFSFHAKEIKNLDAHSVKTVVSEVVLSVTQLEKGFSGKHNSTAIGTSMGSLFAWNVGKEIKTINKIVANTGYSLLSKHIFEDKIGNNWRNKLIQEGFTENSFHKLINNIEPVNTIKHLKNKQILLFLNKDDKVISYSNSVLLKTEMDKYEISYKYIESRHLRHSIAIIKNLHSKDLSDFLKC